MIENFNDIKNQIFEAIEKSNNDRPACKNCKHYSDGACTFGCVNERNGNRYRFNNQKITTPEYSCSNFASEYNLSERTLDNLRDIEEEISVLEGKLLNVKSLLNGKLSEDDFNELYI